MRPYSLIPTPYFTPNNNILFTLDCQGIPAVLPEPAEVPMTVERGPQSRPLPSVDEPPPEREKEAERPDSETESDVDDP